jgi:hypothetical protein
LYLGWATGVEFGMGGIIARACGRGEGGKPGDGEGWLRQGYRHGSCPADNRYA